MATENTPNSTSTTNPQNANEAGHPDDQPLPLPEPPSDTKAVELDVSSGNAVKLDHLGPMVVNRDGTLSRIANWEQMTDIERRNTLRILGKRNQLRMETLKAAEDAKSAAEYLPTTLYPVLATVSIPSLLFAIHDIRFPSMASPKADSVHTEEQIPKDLPDEDRLKEAAAAAEKAIAAQGMANKLRETASTFTDPKKREKMLTDAYNKEKEAHGNSKKARMLQSGAFQGTIGGAGIGGAVSAGVGTLVGTVVGGVTAIPMTGLGALTGAGVGAIHGPFIKLGSLATGGGKKDDKKDGKKDEKKEGEQPAQEGSPNDEDAVPDPKALRQAADLLAEEREKKGLDSETSGDGNADAQGKRKPRKIEIRSGGQKQSSS
ncbi:hypothetical protein N0V90_004298 [Kalmusia sp. IMI 367209]|nr:hypothetical protein N0V90_004298 [Kalmusia sp. IMI 367209]